MHAYLSGILLHKNELYKIKEILIKKGVKTMADSKDIAMAGFSGY